jgi:hypothetical protein
MRKKNQQNINEKRSCPTLQWFFVVLSISE